MGALVITAKLFEFSLPLKKPLTTGVDDRSRTGFLISLSDETGRTGWGEASPLPGLSLDTPDMIRLEWSGMKPIIEDLKIPNTLEYDFLKDLGEQMISPAFRFGMEMALARLISSRGNKAWPLYMVPHAYEVVECNGMISGAPDTWLSQLARIVDQGIRKVKIKMGKGKITEELEAFKKLAGRAPTSVEWRIDANRAWSLEETRLVLMACRDIPLEYVEEPFNSPEAWPIALKLPNAKFALDEQLQSISPETLGDYKNAAAIVLKPTLIGGIIRCWEWAAAAEELGIACTLSSCFESGCGLRSIAELHSVLPGVQLAVGVDTLQWLGGDTSRPPFVVRKGGVEWARNSNGGPAIDIDDLQEIG